MDNGDATDVYTTVSPINPHDYSAFSGYGWDFIQIFHIIIVIIGTISNVYLLVLLIKDKGKKTSATIYFGVMAVCDTIQLTVFMVYDWLYRLMNFAVEETSMFGCKIILALDYFAYTFSTWLVIVLVIERLIYLHCPRMTKLFSRRMTSICVISMLVTIWYLFNSHYMLWYDLKGIVSKVDNTTVYSCTSDSINLVEYTDLYKMYILPILCGICPAVCILIGNVFFIKALYCTATTRMTNGHTQIHGENRDLLVRVMMISILFLMLDTPLTIANAFNLFPSDVYIRPTLPLLYCSIKLFIYIPYKRSFRVHCIKSLARSDQS